MLAQPLPDGRVPVLLSAHHEQLIGQDAWAILDYLNRLGDENDPTVEVASTLLRLRRVRRHRAVVRAADRDELVAALSALAHDEEHPLVSRSSRSVAPSVAFVFPGQGNQWQSMGSEAYRRLAAYRAEADRCAAAFVAAGFPSPLPYLQGDHEQDWTRAEIQGAQFIHAVSLASQWKFCGVLPAITVGHSLGEVAAAYVAEKISLADAAALVGARAGVVDRLTGRYAMVVLGFSLDEAQALITDTPGWLEVSAVNGPSATVVSGDHDAVVAVAELAQARGVFAQQLVVDYPGHTSALRPLGAELAALQPRSAFRDGPMAFIGSAIGAEVGSDTDFSRYWYESLCRTVRFDRAVVAAQKCGAEAFIEMSAHPSLLYPLNELVGDDSAVILGSGHRDGSITDVLSGNIAAAAIADPHYPWADALPVQVQPPLRGFPNAPMRAVHLWAAPERVTTTFAEASDSLTIAVEDWQSAEVPTPAAATRTGIAIVGDNALRKLLTAAAATHRGYDVVAPHEAVVVAVVAPALNQLDVTEAVAQIAGRRDVGLPDYNAIIGPRCRAVWLLTAGGERVLRGDAAIRPAQAALAAMHRSVGFEFGDQTFGSLDLPVGEIDEQTTAAALDVLLGDAGVMALRIDGGYPGPRRYVRTLREHRPPQAARPLDAGALDNVVITGGSGAIGLRYAQYCIERGARRVILLSRNGVERDVLDQLIGQHHVDVHAPRCDITDRAAVAAVAAEFAGAGASLLIHTAGIAAASLREELTGADVAAVCAAKVSGLAAMADVWPLQPECRILACSSVFGVWGGYGHAAYAASNRVLDVLAAQLRGTGLDCTAIRWGLWQDAGVVAAEEITRTERSGLVAMRPESAVAASLGRFADDPLIFDADFDRLRVFFASQGIPMPFQLPADVDDAAQRHDADTRPLVDVVRAELAATLHLGESVSIDATASLIDLGLDSLLALDLRRRLRRAVGHSAPVARMLGGITVNELIDVLGAGSANGQDMGKGWNPRVTDTTGLDTLDAQRLELLRRKIAERGLARPPAAANAAEGEAQRPAMSDGQRRMWFVQSVDPDGALLNICVSYRVTGDVDVAQLHRAVDAVALRHPVLRTTYQTDSAGDPYPVIDDDLRPGWAEHDLSGLAEQARKLRLEVLAQRQFRQPFDLTQDSPLRIEAARVGADELMLLFTAHHIAWDDGSWAPFFTDLVQAYTEGAAAAAGPVPGVAGDPVRSSDEDLAYWRSLMTDLPEPLELPGPNGSVVSSTWRAQRATAQLSAETIDHAAALARETGATPYMVLMAAFGALVHRYTHASDFLVATPVLNRGAGAENAIGYFGNTLVMRMRPEPQLTFRELLAQTRDSAVGALAHSRVDLEWLVRASNPDRRHGAERMTRVSFGLREADGGGFSPPGVQCERAELRGHFSQLPLGLMIELAGPGRGAEVEAEYLVEVLDRPLVDQLLRHYGVLLDHALANPDTSLSACGLMSDADADWLRDVSTGEDFGTPASTLPALVARRAALTPDAVAVVYEGRHYSYREIDDEANRLAHWLIEQGIGTEDRVAVLLDKSPELVITALGVLKSGGVYLPVDPTYPDDRLAFILDDAQAKLVLREPVIGLQSYPAAEPSELIRPLGPENTAYLIYTSGSTGLPKGVPVPHAPIAEYFVWFGDEYRVDETDRLLQVASPSFDVSIGEIFGTLICGARLVIPRPDGLRDIGYLTELLRREGITSMHFVPSLLGLFLSLPGVNQWRTLRRVPIGGEPLPGEIADKFHATFDALLYNFYGPTETIVNATSYPVEGAQGTRVVPIGRPKINTQIHLLDDALQPVPVGVIGEIYIGGTHVARGYHRRPGLTAERFVADPFNPGARLYRSGDLARRNSDGDIEFVGRADEQVKIRGFRIELGEVGAAISVDPSVGQAVVLASDLPGLGKSLVGYVTPADGADRDTVDLDRIRARVAAALPEYMTPAAYVVIDEIPITAHGKIDRSALPEPEIMAKAQYRDPSTLTERRIATLFSELLGHDRVGLDDSFFDLGGHSLVATKLVTAIRSECGVELGIRDVFELGTVGSLAERVDDLRSGAHGQSRPKLVATTHDEPLPLSASQLRSWFAFRVDGPSPVNNIPFAARLTGPWDIDALIAAVGDVVARHEILRTTYVDDDGVPYQVAGPAAELPVRRATGEGEQWLHEQLEVERRHCFELDREWPIRVAVLDTGDTGEHVLSLVVHHIASDHWSAGVLFADVMTAYRARRDGEAPSWAPLRIQYADYAAWQRDFLGEPGGQESAVAAEQRDYWTSQLAGLPEDSGLRPDFPRPPLPSGDGESVTFSIDAATRTKLADRCRELGVTEFMALQAAVAVVLHKAGSGVDIPLGTPVAGRSEAELDQLIGFFVNILVLRNDLGGNPTLRDVLTRARDTALAAYAHQDLPFDRVVDSVSPVRSLSRNPLFGVIVHVRDHLPATRVIESAPYGSDGHDTVCTSLDPVFDMAHADLSVNFFGTDGSGDTGYAGYRGNLIFRTELYRRNTIERLAGWLTRVVTEFANDIDQSLRDVVLADAHEQQRILTQWSRGDQPPADRPRTVPELLEASRQCESGRVAVRCAGEDLDYVALHQRSDNLAALLADRGVRPGSFVGLSTRRGIDMVVALVAIVKAGAAYFPIDPGYPLARKQFMLDDVRPPVVIATVEALDTMPAESEATIVLLDDAEVRIAIEGSERRATPLGLPRPDDPMYLVFTSGSTGKPKGAVGTQRAMAARLDWQLRHYPPRADDIRLSQASMTFLEGGMELLAGLAAGATMILADDTEHRDAEALGALMKRESVAQITAVPSLLSALVDSAPEVVRSLARLVCGGEPVSSSLLQRLTAACADAGDRGPELLNNIGSTETSGAVSRGRLSPPSPLVGSPVAGAQAYLLDDGLRPVPVGVVGELYYAGDQLARGYWKRSALTSTRFIANPFAAEPGSRLYRSGDLARWTADGQLEFAGRADHQVQVRGFRVELAEVEAALAAADGVAAAAARTWEVHDGTSLAGYVVPQHLITDDTDKAAFAAAVRAALSTTLPGYMVPSSLTVLDTLPKTESGKLNRPGLPRPAVSTSGHTEPTRTDTEHALAAVFADLLSTAEVGRFDDFFVLGGDSILSVQLASRARAVGLSVNPRMVFENPTIEQLAAAVDALGDAGDPASADDVPETRFEPMTTSGLSATDLAAVTQLWSKSRDGTP